MPFARRGWSVSAIARHTGRNRKTVSKYLAGPAALREPAPSCLEPRRDYLVARFVDDPHVDGSVLHREVVEFGFDRSDVTCLPSTTCCAASGPQAHTGHAHA